MGRGRTGEEDEARHTSSGAKSWYFPRYRPPIHDRSPSRQVYRARPGATETSAAPCRQSTRQFGTHRTTRSVASTRPVSSGYFASDNVERTPEHYSKHGSYDPL